MPDHTKALRFATMGSSWRGEPVPPDRPSQPVSRHHERKYLVLRYGAPPRLARVDRIVSFFPLPYSSSHVKFRLRLLFISPMLRGSKSTCPWSMMGDHVNVLISSTSINGPPSSCFTISLSSTKSPRQDPFRSCQESSERGTQ